MKKRWLPISIISAAVIIIVLIIITRIGSDSEVHKTYAAVQKGELEVRIETAGEIEAKVSTKVYGPRQLRQARIYQIKITDIVAEGTVVEKGEKVAELDKTEVAEKIKNQQLDLESQMLDLSQAKIDTALTLQQARNELENLQSSMIERKLEVEKSIYEPPVIQKQADAAYAKAQRNYRQAQDDYTLKLRKAKAKIRSANIKIAKVQQDMDVLLELQKSLTVMAPEAGMVMYYKDWRGNKIAKNDMISTWEPVVAELPDLSTLISTTYVNEVDIRKVKTDQPVEINFDAFPDKKMTGKVISVANVGESNKGSKVKVFQVDIEVNGTDEDIKPGMTTGNSILAGGYLNVLFVPIESVFSVGDSVHYVYLSNKLKVTKQEVVVGDRNDRDVIIAQGLKENDKILFTPPEGSESMPITYLNKKDNGLANNQPGDKVN